MAFRTKSKNNIENSSDISHYRRNLIQRFDQCTISAQLPELHKALKFGGRLPLQSPKAMFETERLPLHKLLAPHAILLGCQMQTLGIPAVQQGVNRLCLRGIRDPSGSGRREMSLKLR